MALTSLFSLQQHMQCTTLSLITKLRSKYCQFVGESGTILLNQKHIELMHKEIEKKTYSRRTEAERCPISNVATICSHLIFF